MTLGDNSQAEVGWLLHKDNWKQGYGTEIGNRLLELAFNELNLHRVTAHCDVKNYGSYIVMENIGMEKKTCLLRADPATNFQTRIIAMNVLMGF